MALYPRIAQTGQTGAERADMPSGSCIASRLSRYAKLTEPECAFVRRMEETEESVKAGEVLVNTGEPAERLFILKRGWALARKLCSKGRRQTLRVYLPGEVVGLPSLGISRAAHEVVMVTEGVVCPFPRHHLQEIFEDTPRLAALLMTISSLDQVSLKDRLAMLGVGTARERMAHFLLDIHSRLLLSNPDMGRRFKLPFRQVDIGECLGLTKVYVNRLLKQMTEEGLIAIDRPYVKLLDLDRLRRIADYDNRYEELDLSWFPAPEVRGATG
ncbi:Crp/Fnr family transcriptional regulator [Pseudooceanicola sp. C21-150M6]|uniref:Crp/Fnr family transcriptional regulator n=1 Tax=Pseudooceanicola sp. C21-150M6 TaxID=3434355 RepID=UPI003D7FB56E